MTTPILTVTPLHLARALQPSESARPVPGASRYWITDHGRLISLVDGVRVLRLFRQPTGYIHVELWRDSDRDPAVPARWHAYVHELVALAFIGPRPTSPGVAYEIDHVDGDKSNNHVSNLRYVTKSRNVQLAIAAGRNPTTKLSAVAVWTLRCQALGGDEDVVGQAVEQYGATTQTVRNALSGRTWATIPDPVSRPTASELARALMLTTEAEAYPLLRLSPYSEGYTGDSLTTARVLPFRSSTAARAA